jgi:hypothetical protein
MRPEAEHSGFRGKQMTDFASQLPEKQHFETNNWNSSTPGTRLLKLL